ncbi:MAG TPA: PHP domain-containing protein [Vicinamibacterales bacterium]|nr:PHP domain-containing protein [Vicinamibacterales bacterium]
MIDLHLHTTASDGALSPAALVRRAALAGLTVISITDHDTTAGIAPAAAAARTAHLALVPGIEITAVTEARDLHMLGYFIDPDAPALAAFLVTQRTDRVRRVSQMAQRLMSLGCAIDAAPILADASRGRSVGRPQLAAALVAAGHVRSREEAFARYLDFRGPAFVPRRGPPPEAVIAIVHDAGGLASLAHPGPSRSDHLIPALVDAGLDALEVRHSDHDDATENRYRALAEKYSLLVTGGSDFHDDVGHRQGGLGRVTLPASDFARLNARRA